MPQYDYECEKCRARTYVIVPISESDTLPDSTPDSRDSNCDEHKWRKIILSAPMVSRGDNWGGGKGNWIILILIGVCYNVISYWI